ncbi:MAG: hypothetical protein IJF72_00415 [Clostridia bacterium]|nr:hypothetical protein [Clostridia bacterium]
MKIFKVVCSLTDKFGNFQLLDVYSTASTLEKALAKADEYMKNLVFRHNKREGLAKTYKILCYEQVFGLSANKKYHC